MDINPTQRKINESLLELQRLKDTYGAESTEYQLCSQSIHSRILELQQPPESLQKFMNMLMKKARQESFDRLLASWDLNEDDHKQVQEWFSLHGITVK